MTWAREAPTQRSRPVVRVWRATRVVKVLAIMIAATIAQTGPRITSSCSVVDALLPPLLSARIATISSAV